MSKDDITVVTGGASGIGAACCQLLAAHGGKVVVLDRDGEAAKDLAEEIGGYGCVGDVAVQASLEEAVSRIETEFGAVTGLVNSAGILQRPVSPEELFMESYDDVVAVNQRGTYLASAIFARAMIGRGGGAIVNIASVAGMRSMPLHSYSPTKAAVIAMTACLAAEWGPSGIRVNAVSPGFTLTPALQAEVDAGRRDLSLAEAQAALGRLVRPDEIAQAVAFLLSREASAITGANLPVDCGWLAGTSWTTHGGVRRA
ncbi:MAG: Dehydrogenase [Saliniramus fredricksonii]|uniref:Dehydrogenase n=1 Tax=Saliniramus fredricksonii TaxID=1653334 RepID=A0A0P7Y5P7_9HYPH|nr:SDR family oxidoreductase [Saliniramus fredricksonii]KPQ12582.1 MAG: Dehydrogenase [Saliniramus fredricksonii]SCC82743.1 NAD(P)-dependent dehydrogenase, short-chain alcohol dehydrogenase family [Saliniramus fredricksonii]